MRLKKKYKTFTKTKNLTFYPRRLLNLKRTKWNRLKKIILKELRKRRGRRRSLYCNTSLIHIRKKYWNYKKNAHKNKVLTKRALFLLFSNNYRILKKFKFKKIKEKQSNYLFQFFYFIDYILFLSKFSSNIFLSRELLKQNMLLLNQKPIKSNVSLKCGDFITLKSKLFRLQDITKKFVLLKSYYTFMETDYYSQSLVIILNANNLSKFDNGLAIKNYMNYNAVN